jgi:hypothetical protein
VHKASAYTAWPRSVAVLLGASRVCAPVSWTRLSGLNTGTVGFGKDREFRPRFQPLSFHDRAFSESPPSRSSSRDLCTLKIAVKNDIMQVWFQRADLKLRPRQMRCRNNDQEMLIGSQDLQASATVVR